MGKAGLLLLTQLHADTSRITSMSIFAVFGLGMGFLMQTTTLIVQNSVEPADMGVASSSRTFFQQIGGSIGVSIFGALFIRQLNSAMAQQLPPGAHFSASGQLNPATVASLPVTIQHAVFTAISHAIDYTFTWAIPGAVIVFILAWFIKEIPLRSHGDTTGEPGPSFEASDAESLSPSAV